jgi:hypothetical protein
VNRIHLREGQSGHLGAAGNAIGERGTLVRLAGGTSATRLVGVWALWPKQVIKTIVEPPALVDDYVASATNVMLFDLIAAANAAYQDNRTTRTLELERGGVGLFGPSYCY